MPSPVDLPDPGIELVSPALQVDSLPTELSGKHIPPCVEMILWSNYVKHLAWEVPNTYHLSFLLLPMK